MRVSLAEVITLPYPSRIVTCTAGVMVAPAMMFDGIEMAYERPLLLALTLNALLVVLRSATAVARSV